MLSKKQFDKLLEISFLSIFLFTPFLFSNILATSKASLIKMTGANILAIWGAALILFGIFSGYIKKMRIPIPAIIFGVYIIYNLAVFVLRGNLGANLYEYNKFILFAILLFFGQFADKRKLLVGFSGVLALVLFYGFLQSLGADFIYADNYSRIYSTFGNPNFYAPFILMFLPLYLFLTFKKRKLIYALITFFILWNIKFTRTRGVFIASAVIIAVMLLFEIIKGRKILQRVILLITGIALLFVIGYTAVERGENLRFISNLSGTVKERLLIWQAAMRVPDNVKLFGYGYGSFKRYFPHYITRFFTIHEGDPNIVPSYAHNEYVEQIFETGAIGLSLFLLAFIAAFWPVIRKYLTQKYTPPDAIDYGLALGVIAILIDNFFGVNMRYATTTTYLYFIVGIISVKNSVEIKLDFAAKYAYYFAAFFAAAAILLSSFATVPIVSSTFEQRGSEYDINKNPMQSFRMYKRAYDISNKNDVALYKMGYYFHKYRKDSMQSLNYYKKLRRFSPYYPEVRYTIGTIYFTMGRYARAFDILTKELSDISYNANTHNNLGNVFSQFGAWRSALGQYKRAYYINPNLSLAHVNAGIIYFEQKMPNKAIKELKSALAVSPKYDYAWLMLSKVYKSMGNNAEYERALRNASQYTGRQDGKKIAFEYNDAGKKEYNKKNYKAALANFKKAIETYRDAEFYNNAGLAYYRLNDLTNAGKYYEAGLDLKPDNVLLLRNIAILYAASKKYDKELSVFERLYKILPNDPTLKQSLIIRYRNQGARLFNQGRRREVIKYWQRYKELGGTDGSVISMLEQLKKQFPVAK